MLFERDRRGGEELSVERWIPCEDISALTRAVLLLTVISYGPAMRKTSLNVSQLRYGSLLSFAPSISLRLVKGGVVLDSSTLFCWGFFSDKVRGFRVSS
jgi:hypothetical protein